MAGALVIGNHGAAGRIVAYEGGGTVGPATIGLDALLRGARGHEGRVLRGQLRRQLAQRSDVIDDPDAAAMCREYEVIVARLDRKITHGHCRKVPTFELRPMYAAVDRDPQAKLGAEKQQLRIDGVFLDDVRVAAYALGILPADQRPPGLSKGGCRINVRRHVAESVPIKSDIGAAGCECARLDPAYPSVPGNTRHIADDIVPMLPAIAGQLQVAVIGTDPDQPARHRRLADRIDRGVHLRRRIVDGDTSGLFLLLLLGIVAGQVRRDPLPALTVVARAEQKLRADVN